MVNRLKLNEKALRDAEPKAGVSYQIFDTEVIGFAARIQASGAKTFTIDYRHAGRQRRMTIGRWPEWSVTAARERAKELRRAIDEGHDPLATREDFREAPRVKDMITRYIAEHLPKALGQAVVPTARAAKLTMDRQGIRRLAADELGLPTSPYRFVESEAQFRKAAVDLGFPCVLKPVMSSSGKGQMAVLRRLPKLLKFVPGTAQDVRAYFLTMQYWLAASDDNVFDMIRALVDRYADGERRALRGTMKVGPVEFRSLPRLSLR